MEAAHPSGSSSQQANTERPPAAASTSTAEKMRPMRIRLALPDQCLAAAELQKSPLRPHSCTTSPYQTECQFQECAVMPGDGQDCFYCPAGIQSGISSPVLVCSCVDPPHVFFCNEQDEHLVQAALSSPVGIIPAELQAISADPEHHICMAMSMIGEGGFVGTDATLLEKETKPKRSKSQKRMSRIVIIFSACLLAMSIGLVVLTLALSSHVDEMGTLLFSYITIYS